ncbi:HsdM family class I SAM-dependent methyltransferase [Brachyspira pilosicoli]|uniref:HsdM family class I SAM-dependent methyltransferase n=1 Tax=Brachyspira pilosicoli TaxID=52584 RepID=UPI0012F5192F|nr:N-6 DNA methylase [Brachyspira pilosicoli]
MSNERKTEEMVRKILQDKGYYDDINIIIETQQSDNYIINNLLKNASKRYTGKKGYPEFIISFSNRPNDIIIVECKADVNKHESSDRKNPSDYAVDGVLHYAYFLKEEFNVTAIAVSGENEKEKKISSFLWLKKSYVPREIQENYFATSEELENIIKKSTPLDELDFISKANEYNELLYKYSIPEIERCTLISAILVALQDRNFLNIYKNFENIDNKDLIKSILDACNRILRKNNLDQKKIDVISNEYLKISNNQKFYSPTIPIKKDGKKEEKNYILKNLIFSIEKDILPYIRNEEFDMLGKFYRFFIKYAGSSQNTGLVLTPDHITDFFCDVSKLDVNDIVFDPCCGTGGFLISAMNYMIKKAGIDTDKIKNIKSKQLIGIEERSDMFAHACSNMMMRGDGKSNIIFGDCFDIKNKEEVKLFNPTKTFLNPPYNVGPDGQLMFIENALDCICKGGIAVAICQMSTVVGSNNETNLVKERLLKNHTLKAVFSMPNEIFYPVGVITAILVFEAHTPHSNDIKTFFGYFKNDGFVKTKNKGRLDTKELWSSIKDKWLKAYFNKENIAGLCINKTVTYNDEWCAEAYMETDYTTLTEKDFETEIKKYIAFKLGS